MNKIGLTIVGLGLLGLIGCSSTSNSNQSGLCMAVEAGICAQTADPLTNRAGNGACLQNAAIACGIVVPVVPSPAPTPAPAK